MNKYLSRIALSLPFVIAAFLGQCTIAATQEGTR